MAATAVHSDKLGMKILESIGMEHEQVRRVIVDCEAGAVATVYVEAYASNETLALDWVPELGKAKIVIVEKQDGHIAGSSQTGSGNRA